ncbi:MAG: YeeE/YedE family protein [Xanthobacteraceae bacterium]|nr:YeeE/YedE family protein [Xanthobacteraceae bacterium]
MANFTPLSGAIGGALIGLASALLMLLTGRIAGVSGIFGESLAIGGGDKSWRFSFILGLVIAPLLSGIAGYPLPVPRMPDSWIVIVAAGLLVGFGSRLGGGCTSGHGVCGIARLSPRSLMATVLFMATAMTVVAVMRHVIGA